MAIDEHLFSCLDKNPGTCVRFYRWAAPTASVGYAQPLAKVLDQESCRRRGVEIVRRLTGGKLVLHHKEVTYSVVSDDTETFGSTVSESYRLISEGLMAGLRKMGLQPELARSTPPGYARSHLPCFSHPARDEVEVGGKKIIGSAQKRTGPRFLQHGSIPLEEEEALLKSVCLIGQGLELGLISLSRAMGKTVDFDWAVERFVAGLAEFFGVGFRNRLFEPADTAAIRNIQAERYESEDWTLRGQPGPRIFA